MRLLILGGDGMLGHELLATLSRGHEVKATLRREEDAYRAVGLFHSANAFFGIDVRDIERLGEIARNFRPEAVINAVGVVKQRPEAEDAVASIEINALFPHRLARLCRATDARLVHLSTDCVFSGRKGHYVESDPPDAEDLYGRTKLLGELRERHCVTLRTSMIGLELSRKQGLVEWFLGSRGTVRGFRRAVFSGFTTIELSRLIERILVRHPELSGLWHVAAQPIDKHTLLCRLAHELGRTDVVIEPSDATVCDRSLCPEAFHAATGYDAPSWEEMLSELAQEARLRQA